MTKKQIWDLPVWVIIKTTKVYEETSANADESILKYKEFYFKKGLKWGK